MQKHKGKEKPWNCRDGTAIRRGREPETEAGHLAGEVSKPSGGEGGGFSSVSISASETLGSTGGIKKDKSVQIFNKRISLHFRHTDWAKREQEFI